MRAVLLLPLVLLGVTAGPVSHYPPLSDETRADLAQKIASASLATATTATFQASVAAAAGTDLLGGVGSFSEGTLIGWTNVSQSGGGWYAYSSSSSPAFGRPLPAPFSASWAAVSDMRESSSPMLYKDFDVPSSVVSAILSFKYYYYNYDINVAVPSPLTTLAADNNDANVQFAMVDVVRQTDVASDAFLLPSSGGS
jgi:hypothetical protein